MKALWLTGARKLERRETDHPGSPQASELLVRIEYAGICGSDLSNYKKEPRAPIMLGHEIGGVVERVGEGASGFQPGVVVATNPLHACRTCRKCRSGQMQNCLNLKIVSGGFSEYIRVPAANCYRISDPLLASLAEPLACGIRSAEQAAVQSGDTVVIIGAGIIGLFAMKAAEWRGAVRRILMERTSAGWRWARHGERQTPSVRTRPIRYASSSS